VKITLREKKFLIGGGSIIVLGTLLYLATMLIPSREAQSSSVEVKKRNLAQMRDLVGREELYKAHVEQYRQRLQQNLTRLLPGDNPSIAGAELQKILKDMADQNGVEIVRKDIQREQKVQENLVKVSVRISTNCLPEQLVQFLAAVENYDKFLTVDELVVNSYRMQKKWEIRPDITVSGYIVGSEPKPAEKPANTQ